MWNAGVDESQIGIQISRNINLRYADDTTLMAESEEELRTSSVQFSCSVVSGSLRLHGPQHPRPPCPSPTPGVYTNSCPLSQWCHPTISSSVIHFSSCLQSFPASGSFQMSQLFTSGGQSFGVSALVSVLPMNIQDWLPLGLTGWISLQSKGLLRVFSNSTVQKHQFFGAQLLYGPALTSIHDDWRDSNFNQMDLWWQSKKSLLFNMLSRLIISVAEFSFCDSV